MAEIGLSIGLPMACGPNVEADEKDSRTTNQNAINWPERYLPGTGDNFVCNVADIGLAQGGGRELKDDIRFGFGTFGFPPLDGGPEQRLDVLHAWLVEDLPGGRTRCSMVTRPGSTVWWARPGAELRS